MKKRAISIGLLVLLVLGGIIASQSIKEREPEELITYSNFLSGTWESVSIVSYCWNPLRESSQEADQLIGTKYDLNLWKNMIGGLIPIRDSEKQAFFLPQYDVPLSEPTFSGKYYAVLTMLENNPIIFIKNEDTIYLEEYLYGIYELKKISSEGLSTHIYDPEITFQENIEQRIKKQGISEHYYYPAVWRGEWLITEIIYAENKRSAQKYLNKSIDYITPVIFFDLQFPKTSQERIFYGMPTVEKLGLDGPYYTIIWSEDSEFQAAIVKNEQEMYVIKDNIVLKAVQETPHYDDEFDFEAL